MSNKVFRPPSVDELQKQLKRLIVLKNKSNRSTLEDYVRWESNRISINTIATRLDAVIPLGLHLKERTWEEVTTEDVVEVITTHRYAKGAHRANDPSKLEFKPLCPSTRFQWKVHQQCAIRHILDLDEVPKAFRRTPFRKQDSLGASAREKMVSPQELRALINAAENPRDKAIIVLGLETGFRSGEIAAIKLSGIQQRNHGYWITLPEDAPGLKTGPREIPVPVISGADVLKEWLEIHPRAHDANAGLFVNLSRRNYGSNMRARGVSDVVKTCANRANLPITCHWLRHISTTHAVIRGMNPETLRALRGWSPKTGLQMLAVYTHASSHMESMILKEYGLEGDEPEIKDLLGSTNCSICGQIFPITEGSCRGCGALNVAPIMKNASRDLEEQAIGFVAVELAKQFGHTQLGSLGDATEALREEYRKQNSNNEIVDGKPFVTWALKEWVNRCS